jgi:hypothetical protein
MGRAHDTATAAKNQTASACRRRSERLTKRVSGDAAQRKNGRVGCREGIATREGPSRISFREEESC